jgi:hypothetical protein
MMPAFCGVLSAQQAIPHQTSTGGLVFTPAIMLRIGELDRGLLFPSAVGL